MKIKVIPYKMASGSAKSLAQSLDCFRVKAASETFRYREGTMLINWGNSTPFSFVHNPHEILNTPYRVGLATNKLTAFLAMANNNCKTVEWTSDTHEAQLWCLEGKTIVARTSLTGHSGEGIVLLDALTPWVNAPLYTVYKKKRKEFRVHVVGDSVIYIQEKKRRDGAVIEGDAQFIRSHKNGWVFCSVDDDYYFNKICNLARDALGALHLDFGAVDIIYNEKEDSYYILEVNTAPGLEGTTLEKYSQAFKNMYLNGDF